MAFYKTLSKDYMMKNLKIPLKRQRGIWKRAENTNAEVDGKSLTITEETNLQTENFQFLQVVQILYFCYLILAKIQAF